MCIQVDGANIVLRTECRWIVKCTQFFPIFKFDTVKGPGNIAGRTMVGNTYKNMRCGRTVIGKVNGKYTSGRSKHSVMKGVPMNSKVYDEKCELKS